ncbi:hypothetical protein GJW-30_1_00092 [Variibacter gotjawalensis]|uniref:Uncharacterized protein n=1 Tax=Variibacter gotjawalensis TaxID=1333996 RepID=A0A0S3PNT0_9BRAD|nr:hypothetical protein [Variibacter gotjawalensis]NIK47877.1 hypothetical protein [Variibacter gotjawalensis]RZS49756.1 hypothetical protein EV661_2199 [Variibacter gotjawalensis]BAT57585.1 hypothetical protein GJW-30_1_00092 [Variibacter gotjawalensis]
MAARIVSLFGRASTSLRALPEPWSTQDTADLYRVLHFLIDAGLPVSLNFGKTDEEEPWAVFENDETGDVLVQIARLDGSIVVVNSQFKKVYRGNSLRNITDQILADHNGVSRNKATNVIYLPSAVLTAFVASAVLISDVFGNISKADAAEAERNKSGGDVSVKEAINRAVAREQSAQNTAVGSLAWISIFSFSLAAAHVSQPNEVSSFHGLLASLSKPASDLSAADWTTVVDRARVPESSFDSHSAAEDTPVRVGVFPQPGRGPAVEKSNDLPAPSAGLVQKEALWAPGHIERIATDSAFYALSVDVAARSIAKGSSAPAPALSKASEIVAEPADAKSNQQSAIAVKNATSDAVKTTDFSSGGLKLGEASLAWEKLGNGGLHTALATATSSTAAVTASFLSVASEKVTANLVVAPLVLSDGVWKQTLSSDDTINGQQGSALYAQLSSLSPTRPIITGIESINLSAAVASIFDFSGTTGAKNIAVNGAAAGAILSMVEIQAPANLALQNVSTDLPTYFLFRFADAAIAGSDTKIHLDLQDVGSAASGQFGDVNIGGTLNEGVESLEVGLIGHNYLNSLYSSTSGLLGRDIEAANWTRSYSFSGSGSLTIQSALQGATSVDAGKLAGSLSIALDESRAVVVQGGAGNDRFDFGAGFDFRDGLDGGGGSDTLAVSADLTASSAASLKSIETLEFYGKSTFTFDAGQFASIENIVHKSTASAFYLNLGATQDHADIAILDSGSVTASLSQNASEQAIHLSLGMRDQIGGFDQAVGRFAGAVTTIGAATVFVDVTANEIATKTVAGMSAFYSDDATTLKLTGGSIGQNFDLSNVQAPSIKIVDGSSFIGNLRLSGNVHAQSIVGGEGDDVLSTGGRQFDAADTLSGGRGKDTFVLDVSDRTDMVSKPLLTITDLDLGGFGGTGGDKIDISQLGLVNSANHTPIVLNNGEVIAIQGADLFSALTTFVTEQQLEQAFFGLVSYGNETYLVAQGATDPSWKSFANVVIDVTGVTGKLDHSDIIY